jgi:hypothetical protein
LLRRLPGLIAEIEDAWSITVGRPYKSATEATGAEATCRDRTPAPVKPLRANEVRGTLLLERLRHSPDLLGWPQRAREEILRATAMLS